MGNLFRWDRFENPTGDPIRISGRIGTTILEVALVTILFPLHVKKAIAYQ